MATGALVSVEEYDLIRLRGLLSASLSAREKPWGVVTPPGQRVQVKPTRIRVPDICLVRGQGSLEPILCTPPFVCIELLSRRDTFDSVQERIDDYLAFGVQYIWLLSPRSRRVLVYTAKGGHSVKDGILRTEDPEIVVALAEVFSALE